MNPTDINLFPTSLKRWELNNTDICEIDNGTRPLPWFYTACQNSDLECKDSQRKLCEYTE